MAETVKLNGRKVGVINSKGHYVTHFSNDSYCIKHQGFGISEKIIDHLIEKQVPKVKIVYEKSNGSEEVYIAEPEQFKLNGTLDQLGNQEPQLFLKKNLFTIKTGTGKIKQSNLPNVLG